MAAAPPGAPAWRRDPSPAGCRAPVPESAVLDRSPSLLLPKGACACVSPRRHPAPARSPLSRMHKWGLQRSLVDLSLASTERSRLAPRLRRLAGHRRSVPATAALCVEESRTTSGAIAAILVSREPSLSLPPSLIS